MRWLVFVASLTLTRLAHAGAVIAGLSGDASFTVAGAGTWTHTFVMHADGAGALPNGPISVRITDFQSDSGKRAAPRRPVEVTWLGEREDRHDAASFTVSVTLPEPDLYVATVVIAAPGEPIQVRQLSLQVGAGSAPATALPVALVGPHDVEASGDEATISLGFRNTATAAHTLAISPPIVTHKRAGRVMPADVAVRWQLVVPRDSPPGNTVRLPGGGDAAAQVTISEAPPGEYAVEIQVGEPGLPPATISGTVFVKRGIGFAILLIAGGVLLASAISRLRDVWLDSQSQRINLGRILERLQVEPGGDAARDALRELRQQVTDLGRAVTDRRDCKADIENLGRRAVVFVRANAAATEIAELGDGRRTELRRKLDEVFRLIALPNGEAAATDKLSELENKDAEREELKAALDAATASIAEHQIEADAAFTAVLVGLTSRMSHVRELYQRDELDAAEKELGAIRDALARAGREAIQRASDRPPAWTSDASWKQAMTPVKTMLAAPGASYDDVRGAFVDASVALTVREADHPDTAKLAAAADMPSKVRLLAAIHGDLARQPQPRGLGLNLFEMSPALEIARPRHRAARTRPAPFEWRALARRSMRVELLVLGVVMAIAVLAGVKALWIDNATWGSWADLLAAFLWGSGVQVGVEAFVGLSALRAALGRRS